MRELHEVWLEPGEDGGIHIGTPKQIASMQKNGEIPIHAYRILAIPDSTFEEAEEQCRLYMEENGLEEDEPQNN